MNYRFADPDDAPLLAEMNKRLIEDEGHRNPMNAAQLQRRMQDWLLGGEYQAVVFEGGADRGNASVGYALFRQESDHIYLRQFFVGRECRRTGVGRDAIAWLRRNVWGVGTRVRVDVLVANERAIAFWRSVGFADHALTLEIAGEPPAPQ